MWKLNTAYHIKSNGFLSVIFKALEKSVKNKAVPGYGFLL